MILGLFISFSSGSFTQFSIGWILQLAGGLPFFNAAMLYMNELGTTAEFGKKASTAAVVLWALGEIIFASAAWYLQEWRRLVALVIALPSVLLFIAGFKIPESKHFLERHGIEDVPQTAKNEADSEKNDKANVTDSPDKSSEGDEVPQIVRPVGVMRLPSGMSSIGFILNGDNLLITVKTTFLFVVINILYVGPLYGLGYIGGNMYVNGILTGTGELIGYLLSGILILYVQRRHAFVATYLILGLAFSTFFIAEIPTACLPRSGACWQKLTQMVASVVGRIMVGAQYSLSYVYLSELYPAFARGTAVGFASSIGALGGVVAPIFNSYLDHHRVFHPMALYGIISFVAAIPLLTLPETRIVTTEKKDEDTKQQNLQDSPPSKA
jgi:hypothetical protein